MNPLTLWSNSLISMIDIEVSPYSLLEWCQLCTCWAAVLADLLVDSGRLRPHHYNWFREHEVLPSIPHVSVPPSITNECDKDQARYHNPYYHGPRDARTRDLEHWRLCLSACRVKECRADLQVVVCDLDKTDSHAILIEYGQMRFHKELAKSPSTTI